MPKMTPGAVIEERLSNIILPDLQRPAVGPDDDATKDLVLWGVKSYVFSSIAHVRTILAGLKLVAASGNRPTVLVIGRHVYEWTMHACYMHQQLAIFTGQKDWNGAWEIFLEADTGNSWVKKHGTKYLPVVDADDVPNSLRIKKLVDAYSSYQMKTYNKDDAKNDYGYLSEHSHANGMCFLDYRRIVGSKLVYIEPETRFDLPGVLEACVTEWVMFICGLLALAEEDAVRVRMLEIVESLAALAKD
jgi:hypothetical protein